MKTSKVAIAACFAALLTLAVAALAAGPKPKHINRAIELLEQGQPIYYTGSHSGTAGTFEQGVKDAQTYADYISYDMEHAPFDVRGLAEYMRGLAEGGPAKSGHRTPAVIVNVPVTGIDEAAVRANAWMFAQVLATGVHGILLCHADSPAAVRAFIEAVRFPIHKQGWTRESTKDGAASMACPLRPRSGGFRKMSTSTKRTLGRSIRKASFCSASSWRTNMRWQNADEILKIPGVAFAEWGPGDMALSLGVRASGQAAVQDPGDAARPRQGPRRLQGQQAVLPELVRAERRDRHDQGRRHDRTGQPADRRDRPQVHEAGDAVVNAKWAILALGAALASAQPPPNRLTDAESKAGWKLLFDGKEPRRLGAAPHLRRPTLREIGASRMDSLLCPGTTAGWLASSETYTDYVLKLEFRGNAQVNSGVFLRSEKTGQPHITGYELQIWDYQPAGFNTGSLVNSLKATAVKILPDQWNTYEITADGDHYRVVLNGKTILDGHDSKHVSAGVVGFQCQPNNRIEFRNIRLLPLNR